MDDITTFSHRRLATILRNPDHPHHAAAKAEKDRRNMQREGLSSFKNFDEATYSDTGWQKPSVKKDKFGNVIKTKNIAKSLAKAAAKQSAGVQNETKGAPKGYHFTRDGKLKKGDAGADGDGGAKLRSDPLDKQRSKIPPLPEKFANAAQQAAVMAKLKKSGKYDGKEDVKEVLDTPKAMDSYRNKAKYSKDQAAKSAVATVLRSKDKAQRDHPAKDLKTMDKRTKGLKMADRNATNKTFKALRKEEVKQVDEISKKTLGSYIKKAGPDAVKQTAQAKRHSDAGDMADKDRDMYKHYGKSQRAMDKAKNRTKGINKAVDKLTREATIPDGQTAMTKRPELTNNDKDKLAKIRKMLDREKKK